MESVWTPLTEGETDEIWRRFRSTLRFHPSIHSENFPGIREPAPFETFALPRVASDQLVPPLDSARWPNSADLADLNEAMLAAFRACTKPEDRIYALDWQHRCFWFAPHLFAPVDHYDDWPISIIPNGDYYIFLAPDLSWGTFGHPWEWTICVFGEKLLKAMESRRPRLFTTPIRQGPPAVGSAIVEDDLTAPGVLRPSDCPTKLNRRTFEGGQARLTVTGRCSETATDARADWRVDGLDFGDGEVRFEARSLTGLDRSELRVWLRLKPGEHGYFARIFPSRGRVRFSRWQDQRFTTLVESFFNPERVFQFEREWQWKNVFQPERVFQREAWNTLAVRAQGSGFWVLLNDQVIASASDEAILEGRVVLGLVRTGALDDTEEVAMEFRNLRVSALAQTDAARVPKYVPPPR